MKSGKYVIESIENDLVKLLFSDNEEMEELVLTGQFNHPVKPGDILDIKMENGKWTSNPLPVETEKRREQAKTLLEKLINRSK